MGQRLVARLNYPLWMDDVFAMSWDGPNHTNWQVLLARWSRIWKGKLAKHNRAGISCNPRLAPIGTVVAASTAATPIPRLI